ncbi:AraC family transcriptional regulator [Halopolyspora algeriensis]|uniref:AraC family transcriptional regulator n=1 Tax=Halopolyspora algeriensis TaxID=1500506 RepID=A0A368VS05_9ACTN|nr:helix-turn-helix domain-containing protein [Halopolyspora algeriensis]RCW42746.1 AraC family transcriptional regulator [Halopolyspora algeriensis]TQM56784.1 AraC family transcriptional regulator [Halopolyspora algeriensis]
MFDRLNEAMEHIERHVTGEIDVRVLARIAQTSEYHFRRLFSALAGMPLSEYIRRRRLTLAGGRVLSGEQSLLDIAVTYGYGSGEAFARAFRSMHGVGPADARRSGMVLRSQPRMTFHLTIEGSTPMDYRIVDKDAFRLLGHSTVVPIVHLGPNSAIDDFVSGIGADELARLEALSDQEPRGIVAAVESLDACREEGARVHYLHGVVSSAPTPQGASEWDMPASTWAVFAGEGKAPEAIQYLWRDVFTQWFPSNPYRSVPGPEILRTELSANRAEMSYELWIPVEHVE